MNEKDRKKYGRKILSDILSMFWHIGMSDMDELRKQNIYGGAWDCGIWLSNPT